MDKTEIIALSVVAIAVLLAVRHYRKNKGSCCGTDCSQRFKGKDEGKK